MLLLVLTSAWYCSSALRYVWMSGSAVRSMWSVCYRTGWVDLTDSVGEIDHPPGRVWRLTICIAGSYGSVTLENLRGSSATVPWQMTRWPDEALRVQWQRLPKLLRAPWPPPMPGAKDHKCPAVECSCWHSQILQSTHCHRHSVNSTF